MPRITIILALVLGAASYGIWSAQAEPIPPIPSFAGPNGAPVSFGVDGPGGKPVICPNGKELRVSSTELFSLPPAPEELKRRGAPPESKVDKVWRCGLGANPDRNPRLIPASQDPLR